MVWRRNKWANGVMSIFLFVLFVLYYGSIYRNIPVSYWDEMRWVGHSFFFDLIVKRDWSHPLWQTTHAFDQPKLAELAYGVSLNPLYRTDKEKPKNQDKDFVIYLIDHNLYDAREFRVYPIVQSYLLYQNNLDSYITWDGSDIGDEIYYVAKYGEGIRKTLSLIYRARLVNVFTLSTSVALVFLIVRLLGGIRIAVLSSLFFGFNTF